MSLSCTRCMMLETSLRKSDDWSWCASCARTGAPCSSSVAAFCCGCCSMQTPSDRRRHCSGGTAAGAPLDATASPLPASLLPARHLMLRFQLRSACWACAHNRRLHLLVRVQAVLACSALRRLWYPCQVAPATRSIWSPMEFASKQRKSTALLLTQIVDLCMADILRAARCSTANCFWQFADSIASNSCLGLFTAVVIRV